MLVVCHLHITEWKLNDTINTHIANKLKINIKTQRRKKMGMLPCKQTDLVKILWVFGYLNLCVGFYLPGIAPKNYCKKSEASEACKVSNYLRRSHPSVTSKSVNWWCVRSFSITFPMRYAIYSEFDCFCLPFAASRVQGAYNNDVWTQKCLYCARVSTTWPFDVCRFLRWQTIICEVRRQN